MTTVLVRRPARIEPPAVPAGELLIADPPKLATAPPSAASASMIIMPVISGAGSLLVAITNPGRPLFAAAGLLFLVASVAVGGVMIFSQRSGPRRTLREARERYLDYVEDLRVRLRATVAAQQAAARWRHPEPARLLDLARIDARRWERRPGDPDFLELRLGTGTRAVATRVAIGADDGPLNEFDPVCLDAARALRSRYASLRDQPVCVALRDIGVLSVVGDRDTGRTLAQALAAQLVATHAPAEVRLAVVRSPRHADDWEWAKWLPHSQHPYATDGEVPARLITADVPAMAELLGAELEARLAEYQRRRGQPALLREHLVVIIDGEHLHQVWGLEPAERAVNLAELGVHLVLLLGHRREEPEEVHARITVAPGGGGTDERDGASFAVDEVPPGLLISLARQCAPLRLVAEEAGDVLAGTVGLAEILGVPDVAALDPHRGWAPRPLRELLRVPIGIGTAGTPVMVDLKEAAHGGMGPHGLLVGATGSGKSELLRTLLASLAIGHPPEQLALMLVDFKGGATFAPMAGLPQVAGMITNIEEDLTLVDRMRDALYGEMRRRQEVLKAAGNLPNVTAYQDLRAAGAALAPLPHLLVVIDEFSELLAAKPDFAELFVAIGRIGRSIGVHLLLATQRLELGRIRGLESHLSYRISLRTFSEAESREAISVPDAYHLPPEPGTGLLKVDTTVFERFRAALVSAPYAQPGQAARTVAPVVPYVGVNGLGRWLARQSTVDGSTVDGATVDGATVDGASTPAPAGRGAAPVSHGAAPARTVLDLVVARLRDGGAAPVRPVWLDPLPPALPLDRVQHPDATAPAGTLRAVLGLVDEPAAQRQYPLEWDFTGAAGNLLVLGAPQSGKSTLLRTMVASMALRYAPGDIAFYCVDYGGGALAPLADLPHVAGVAPRADPERVSRTIAEVTGALEARERLFREYGLDSPQALRQARADGRVPASVAGAIILVIDGWGSFRDEHDLLEIQVGEIAARGLNYGVHVVLTLTQTMQVRLRMQAAFGGRLELRLTDPFDSGIDRKAQERLDPRCPGRGLIAGGLAVQVALPRADGGTGTDDLGAAQRDLIALVARRWPRGAVSAVAVLPARYAYRELPPVDPDATCVPVGISERDLRPVAVDLHHGDPHLLVYGDGETGKSNLLRVLLRGYQSLYPPQRLGIVVVDYRRSLLDVVAPEYLLAYCTTAQRTRAVADEVAGSVAVRLPGPEVTAEQLRTRSWWRGLEVLVVVDDYDLVATSAGNPLAPLTEYLAQARDLGLHLVLARRTGGLSRAVFEPVLQRLGDIATPGFLFSGDRAEGRLVNGVASQRLPVGRALYAARGGGYQQVQVAWADPAD